MNRITTTWLTLGSAATLFALGTACSSGGSDGGAATAGKTSTGSSGNTGTGGTGTSGSSTGTSGSSTGTSGSSTGTSGSTTGGSTTGGSTTGGSTTGGSTSGPSVCDGMTTILPVTLAYIDNFDDGLRADGWYSFSDTATPDTPPKPAYETGGAVFPTGKFAHIIATGIKSPTMMGYGAGFGFNLVDPSKEKCIDLSAFEGISFWAKGTAGATNGLQFQAVVPETAPTKDGGDCPMVMNTAGMMVPGPDCYLHPSKMITITTDWKQYTVKFADLTAKKAKWKGLILGFNMITPGPAYDVEVDEFSFYVTGMVPPGHVTPPVAGTGGSGGGGTSGGGNGGTGGT